MTQEVLKLALEMVQNKMYAHAEMYLQEALAQPEQPAQRTWVGLTDVEIDYLLGSTVGENEETHISFARAIESKLKQKNAFAEEKNT